MSRSSKRGVFKGALHDARRLREIAFVLSKHGFKELTRGLGLDSYVSDYDETNSASEAPLAIRVRRVFEDLGPTYIKMGQILSTRLDLLPPVYIQELQKLQDRAPSVPFEEVAAHIESEFGQPLDKLFSEFDAEEIATASMAQVHRATLFDGREVVVKVQRPGIAPIIRSDLAILYYLARIGEATIDEIGLFNPVAIVKEFERAIIEELNFMGEAANNERARLNAIDIPEVLIPEVIAEFTTPTIITQTYVDGHKLSTIEIDSYRAQRLAKIAMEAAFQQIFVDGFFHGDPHPGNMLVTDDDRVAFLDWGLVGRLSRGQQDELVDLIISVITDDIDGITRTVLRMGYPDKRVNLRRLRRDISKVRDTHLTRSLSEMDLSSLMEDIMEIAHDHRIHINPEYALVTKCTATVEGILRSVYPSLDIIGTLRPFAERLFKERYSAEQLMKRGLVTLTSLNHLLKDVPMQFDQVLMDLEAGDIRVNVAHPSLDQHLSAVNVLGSRIFLGFLAAGFIVASSVLISTFDWRPWDIPLLAILGLLGFSTAMILSFAALAWHFTQGGLKKVRVGPILKFFWRK